MTAATAARFVEDATLLSAARRALAIEARAVEALGGRLGPEFVAACRLCLACTGRVIVTGIGKSGHVGRKIAATLASTGTPGFFLHAAEASHGDLGMITASDVVLALSNSGESPELVFLLPHLKRLATPLITLTGNLGLDAGTQCHGRPGCDRAGGGLSAEPRADRQHHRHAGHGRCAGRHAARSPRLHGHRFRPLPSGRDAGAAAVPAGRGHHAPRRGAAANRAHRDARAGPAGDVAQGPGDDGDRGSRRITVLGVFTDGDLRRLLDRQVDIHAVRMQEVMTAKCRTIGPHELAAEGVHLMDQHRITVLPVIADGRLLGAFNVHDLLRAGVM